jgi:hypothetical protein
MCGELHTKTKRVALERRPSGRERWKFHRAVSAYAVSSVQCPVMVTASRAAGCPNTHCASNAFEDCLRARRLSSSASILRWKCLLLAAIAPALEVDVELEDATFKHAFEAALLLVFPLAVHNFERYVFVWSTRSESKNDKVGRVGLLKNKTRCLKAIDEIRIEDVELVALNRLRRRIVMIVVRLVVLVPVVPGGGGCVREGAGR